MEVWVPRRLGWVKMCSRGQPQVEFASEQVDYGLEVADRAVASGLRLGRLHQAVDALDQTVGDLAVEPAQDAVPVALDGVGRINDRFEPAVGSLVWPFHQASPGGTLSQPRPEIPLPEEASGGFDGWLF